MGKYRLLNIEGGFSTLLEVLRRVSEGCVGPSEAQQSSNAAYILSVPSTLATPKPA